MEAQRWVTDVGGGPMVARWGSEHPSVPVLVLLHGNGTSEHSLIEMSPWLPHGPVAYVAVRAPFERRQGYGWYTDPGDGPPDPDELARSARWLLDWIETEGDPERPVLLLGFREGVTVAGAMMLLAPERFAGGLLLYGALPLDAGLPTERGRLLGMPVYLAQGTDDTRTPAAQLALTRAWLARESGAPTWADEVEGGDQVAGSVVGGVGTWLADRLDHLRAHGENPLPDGEEPPWPELPGGRLPARVGEPPETTGAIPHRQTSQVPPAEMREALWDKLSSLDGVTPGEATVGPAGTRSLLLDRGTARGPDIAYLLPDDGEFAHLHPPDDGALHLALPEALAYDATAKGWAVPHPLAGLRLGPGAVLVPGPRDDDELGVVAAIVAAAHRHATVPS
ncbi:luciferase family protein [Pseudonocardia endophytica]|uniref:Phospholipase/carboxylesterase n=1 Tax=Pseudonocardia endophytica TaxID=401976 RepID=A0A4R1HSI3_PSEEN|nr:luciferase family protein [Pseudonocardia endophytica]TCK22809.1 phospholipase/carboxylesterase [Pseudonocardia endophytica]